jgi:hypothetical protein
MRDAQPITIAEHAILISNGVHPRPCKLVYRKVFGVDIATISRCSKDWCRLLCNRPAFCRPLAHLDVWAKLGEAIRQARYQRLHDKVSAVEKRRPMESLEASDDDSSEAEENVEVTKGQRRQIRRKVPVITISMPLRPGSSETFELQVLNYVKGFGMELTLRNVQWLVDYIKEDTKDEESKTARRQARKSSSQITRNKRKRVSDE